VRITNFGARVMAVMTPDSSRNVANIVLGYETPEEYRADTRYLGAIVGRYANRIGRSRFTLDGTTYQLSANEGPHHLHGGRRGFDQAEWDVERAERNALVLRHVSPDGDEGYPGTLEVRVTYLLTNKNELVVDYAATADKPTPVNLTQHSYYNLAGAGAGSILDHSLQLNAHAITMVDGMLIPTGRLLPVMGTDFDFHRPARIGARRSGDYDVNYVLTEPGGESAAARAVDTDSGRTLEVRTTEPGLQLYTGGAQHDGFCLETQHYPDSPNQPDFPSTILRPGAAYRSRTVFTFGVT
jgi:aldose 1-epimerase